MIQTIKQNLEYFIVTTSVIAFIGMMTSKLSTGHFDVIGNLIGSVIGALVIAYMKSQKS